MSKFELCGTEIFFDEQEHVSSKPSKKHSKDSKDHESDKEHDVLDNVSEQPEDIYLKITREHLNLPEVQKLLGYSTVQDLKIRLIKRRTLLMLYRCQTYLNHNSRQFSRLF